MKNINTTKSKQHKLEQNDSPPIPTYVAVFDEVEPEPDDNREKKEATEGGVVEPEGGVVEPEGGVVELGGRVTFVVLLFAFKSHV